MDCHGRICCFTSLTYAYLGRANLLAETVRAHHPDWLLFAVIVDQPPNGVEPRMLHGQFDQVINAADLDIASYRAWLFKHDVVEACTAVKGAMLLRLLERGASKVIYLDPDIAVFHGLDEIVALLDRHSILLTPHQVEPNTDAGAIRDNDLAALRYGLFNLGFLAVRNDTTAGRFAAWWHARLLEACYDDVPAGIFTDQKYCDLVPCLFDGVQVHRDPGCNVASWNLSKRRVTIDRAGIIRVNDSPLKFYHFTKIGGVGDIMTERYGGDNVEVFEIWSWYRRMLARRSPASIPAGYWHYGRFQDGELILKPMRERFRALPDAFARFSDPFGTGPASYRAYLGKQNMLDRDAA